MAQEAENCRRRTILLKIATFAIEYVIVTCGILSANAYVIL